MKNKLMPMALAVLLALAGLAAPVGAADLDLRVGAYTGPDFDKPFAGVGLLSHLGGSLYFNPNVEYVFVDHAKFGTLNFDVHYDLPTGGRPYLWLGGGLALAHTDLDGPGGNETKPRANLLAGIGFRTGGSVPYVQVKYLTGYEYLVVAAGIRF